MLACTLLNAFPRGPSGLIHDTLKSVRGIFNYHAFWRRTMHVNAPHQTT